MTGPGALEVLVLLLLSTVLIAVGLLLLLLGARASQNEGTVVKSKGLVVLLLGPIPLVLRGSARIALLAFVLVAGLLLLLLFLVF